MSADALAVVLHSHGALPQHGLNEQRCVWTDMLDAERCFRQLVPPGTKDALALKKVQRVAWNQLQTSRECLLICNSNNWQAHSQAIQEQATLMFSGPANTKYDLKDLFAHLVSVARASNIPTVMNKLHVHVKFSRLVNSGVPFLDSYASNVMEFNHTMWRRRWTRFFYCTSLARGTKWGLYRA